MTVSQWSETDFLDQELLLSQQLLHLLEQEKVALMADDVEALMAITPEKSRLISSFLTGRQQLQRERAARAQVPSQPDHADKGVAQRREQLLALQQAAKQSNLTNGLMIQRLSARNQSALTVLRGQSAPGLYGPNGQGINSSLFGVTKAVPG